MREAGIQVIFRLPSLPLSARHRCRCKELRWCAPCRAVRACPRTAASPPPRDRWARGHWQHRRDPVLRAQSWGPETKSLFAGQTVGDVARSTVLAGKTILNVARGCTACMKLARDLAKCRFIELELGSAGNENHD